MKKKWTILLIPAATAEVRDITISMRLIMVVLVTIAAILVASALFCAKAIESWEGNNTEWKEDSINTINQLRSDMAKRDEELSAIKTEYSKLLELEDKLRATAGLKPRKTAGATGAGKGGQGGPEPEEALPPEADQFLASESPSAAATMPANTLIQALIETQENFSETIEAFEREQRRLASIPSINPVAFRRTRISSGFGYRSDPIDGKRRFHDGIDLAAPVRTPIVAPADGIVTFSGWHGGLGRMIEISHGYGYRTVYGHNTKLLKKTGQHVKRGDTIAYLGSTGRSTGPHLHYEVRYKGKVVNPYKYLID